MTTNIEYQVLGNTLRIRQTKDIITDLNVFDAITSPNNSVMHGGIYCNILHDTSSSSNDPGNVTAPTSYMAILSGNDSTNNNVFKLTLGSGYNNANSQGNGTFGSVTIDNTTFYGTKIGTFACVIGKQTGTTSSYLNIRTANIKITVIRYVSASGEIITEEYTQSTLFNSVSGSYSNSTMGRITLQIPKATDDLLLFIGIENIFETT